MVVPNVGHYVDARQGASVILINGCCLVGLASGMGVSSAIMANDHPIDAPYAAVQAL